MGIIKDLNDWDRVRAAYNRLTEQPNHTARDLERMQQYKTVLLRLREKTKPARRERKMDGEENHQEF